RRRSRIKIRELWSTPAPVNYRTARGSAGSTSISRLWMKLTRRYRARFCANLLDHAYETIRKVAPAIFNFASCVSTYAARRSPAGVLHVAGTRARGADGEGLSRARSGVRPGAWLQPGAGTAPRRTAGRRQRTREAR